MIKKTHKIQSMSNMFVGGITGMERVISNDIEPPYLSLVTGPPGSMKTSFSLSMISNHLKRTGEFGLYCTVEETVDSLLKTCNSMGLELPTNLQITDLTELRKENEAMDYLKFTKRMIQHFKQERGSQFSVFILDSLGAIYSLTSVDEEMRKKMFGFFDFLRTQGLYTFIITERQPGEHAELQGNEGFIADGIINLGLDRRNGKIVRTLQIEKMRHVRHSMEKQAIDISSGSVTILGPLFD